MGSPPRLNRARTRALEGLDILSSNNSQDSVDMATLRANGHRRDVIRRLCEMGLAYAASFHSDPDHVRYRLTAAGGAALAREVQKASAATADGGRTAAATAVVVRRGDETAAKRLRGNGWLVLAPELIDTLPVEVRAALESAGVELPAPKCPHRCGPLRWVDDAYICDGCEDEWGYEVIHGTNLESPS